MASQVKEISLLDFLACSWNPLFSVSRCCLVGTAPGVASGVACHIAERLRSLRRRRHDEIEPCRQIQLMRQTALRGCGAGGCTVYLGNMRSTVRSDKVCPACRGGRACLNHTHSMRWVGEPSNRRLVPAPALVEHVAAPDPPAVCLFYARGGGADGREGSRTVAGGPGPLWGSEASAVGSELPLLRGTWRLRTRP